MNILMVPSWYKNETNSISGSFFREQALALVRRGHRVWVADATFQGADNLKSPRLFRLKQYDDEGLCTYSLVVPALGIARTPSGGVGIYCRNLGRIFQRMEKDGVRIDLIQAHSFYPAGVAAVRLGKKHGIPVVLTEHNSNVLKKTLPPKRVQMLKEAVAGADRVVCVSNALKKAMQELTGTEREIDVLYNSVDSRFTYVPKPAQENFTFVSAGNLIPVKRFDLTLEAFARLYREDPSVRLTIAGGGYLRQELEALAADLGVADAVAFSGRIPREQMSALLQGADAFVLPSDAETFGVVYIEALACGKPVIGARNGGAEEIITAGNGLLVEKNDATGLYEAMKTLRKEISRYSGAALAADCEARFGEETLAKQTLAIYRSLRP